MRERVYPHVCGGIAHVHVQTASPKGLSPRVRGHRQLDRGARLSGRSIPTCAGASLTAELDAAVPQVYPHVCGGIQGPSTETYPSSGLSPRVRGHHVLMLPSSKRPGSIPTCAGASPRSCPPPLRSGVYPHVCGGITTARRRRSQSQGLSPRVRGHRPQPALAVGQGGSIPTCAGASALRTRSQQQMWVYPHVCGGI